MVGFCTSFADATGVIDDLKSTYYATALAMQLFLHPINVVIDNPISTAIDPLGKLDWVETLPEYLERSVIKVQPDVVEIDGVQYSNIWLGPEAAQKLRTGVLDFATAYNILNDESLAITYATGAGTLDGVPFYNVNGEVITPSYVGSETAASESDLIGYNIVRVNQTIFYNWYWTDGIGNPGLSTTYKPPTGRVYQVTNVNFAIESWNGNFWQRSNLRTFPNFDNTPFSFDYTSGVIDAPIAEEDGLLIQVPTQYTNPSAPQYNYNIHDLVNIYPQVQDGHYVEIDPDLNPEFENDIDLSNDLGTLIRIIMGVLDLLDNTTVEFAPEPDPEPQPEPDPSPPPSPVPSTPVSDQPGDWLDQVLRWIQETIAQVKHATQTLEQTLLQIKEAVQTLPQQILEDIETAPISIYRNSLEIIKTVFAPILLLLKATIGLWHYVVEWVQATSPVFSSFFGLMNGTSYNMVLPIYASLAGPIVIAVYKRFGK